MSGGGRGRVCPVEHWEIFLGSFVTKLGWSSGLELSLARKSTIFGLALRPIFALGRNSAKCRWLPVLCNHSLAKNHIKAGTIHFAGELENKSTPIFHKKHLSETAHLAVRELRGMTTAVRRHVLPITLEQGSIW